MRHFVLVMLVGVAACAGDKDDADTDGGGSDTDATTDTDTDPTDTVVDTPPPDTGTVPDPSASIEVERGPVTCAAPATRSDAWFEKKASPTAKNTDELLPYEPWVWGSGLVAADFDRDGWVDLFASNESTPKLYRNAAGILQDLSASLSAFDLELSSGGAAADFDGDGDEDLFVTRYMRPNVLLRNEGDGSFADVTAVAGVGGLPEQRSMAASWADIDGDDDLDLYVGNYGFVDETAVSQLAGEPDYLYLNNGDGTFTDVSDRIPVTVQGGYTYATSWIDLNGDLRPEMYIVNDFGTSGYPDALLWNDGAGNLTLADPTVGLNGPFTGMGVDIADLNADGSPDFIIPVWAGMAYLESNITINGPVWVESSASRALDGDLGYDQKVAWGGNFGDLDNDGDTDLVMQYGYVVVGSGDQWGNPFRQPDGMFVQGPDGLFDDVSHDQGFDDMGVNRGAVLVDFNHDGFLDVAKRDLNGTNLAYLSNCDTSSWIDVDLHREWGMNRDAIGAKVVLTSHDLATCPAGTDPGKDGIGPCQWTGWVQAGGVSLASSEPNTLHFGLATLDRVEKIEVTWPDGRTSIFRNVDARQVVRITQDPPTP